MRQLRQAVATWSAADLRMAGATLVRSEGSTPHQLGLTLVTNESGDTVGALSGGCVDADIVLACDRVLASGPAEVLTFGADDGEFDTGLVCGGVITVTYDGAMRNPVPLARRQWTPADQLEGDTGLSAVVRRLRPLEVECGDVGSVIDIDTPADLAHALAAQPRTGDAG